MDASKSDEMGLTLNRLWFARTRRRIPSRSSSEDTLSTNASQDGVQDSTAFESESLPMQERELPILDGGSPIARLPQDLLLRYGVHRSWVVCVWRGCLRSVCTCVERGRKEDRERKRKCVCSAGVSPIEEELGMRERLILSLSLSPPLTTGWPKMVKTTD